MSFWPKHFHIRVVKELDDGNLVHGISHFEHPRIPYGSNRHHCELLSWSRYFPLHAHYQSSNITENR